jgi:predicted metalloendopeptidase
MIIRQRQPRGAFETHGRLHRPVDKTEWHMTPETVNAYFNPLQTKPFLPAGILNRRSLT